MMETNFCDEEDSPASAVVVCKHTVNTLKEMISEHSA